MEKVYEIYRFKGPASAKGALVELSYDLEFSKDFCKQKTEKGLFPFGGAVYELIFTNEDEDCKSNKKIFEIRRCA